MHTTVSPVLDEEKLDSTQREPPTYTSTETRPLPTEDTVLWQKGLCQLQIVIGAPGDQASRQREQQEINYEGEKLVNLYYDGKELAMRKQLEFQA